MAPRKILALFFTLALFGCAGTPSPEKFPETFREAVEGLSIVELGTCTVNGTMLFNCAKMMKDEDEYLVAFNPLDREPHFVIRKKKNTPEGVYIWVRKEKAAPPRGGRTS